MPEIKVKKQFPKWDDNKPKFNNVAIRSKSTTEPERVVKVQRFSTICKMKQPLLPNKNYMNYAEKFIEYKRKHGLENPKTKLKYIGSSNRNIYKY